MTERKIKTPPPTAAVPTPVPQVEAAPVIPTGWSPTSWRQAKSRR